MRADRDHARPGAASDPPDALAEVHPDHDERVRHRQRRDPDQVDADARDRLAPARPSRRPALRSANARLHRGGRRQRGQPQPGAVGDGGRESGEVTPRVPQAEVHADAPQRRHEREERGVDRRPRPGPGPAFATRPCVRNGRWRRPTTAYTAAVPPSAAAKVPPDALSTAVAAPTPLPGLRRRRPSPERLGRRSRGTRRVARPSARRRGRRARAPAARPTRGGGPSLERAARTRRPAPSAPTSAPGSSTAYLSLLVAGDHREALKHQVFG